MNHPDEERFLSQVIAHRGASAYAPENTLAALQLAHDMGARWVEFDIRLTKENDVIVMHDRTLKRTTDGRGLVRRTPMHIIESLDAGSWYSNDFIGEKIPTFYDWCERCLSLDMKMNIELKPSTGSELILVRQMLVVLSRIDFPLDNIIVSSGSYLALKQVARLAPAIKLGMVMADWRAGWQQKAQDINAYSVHPSFNIITKKQMALIKQLGLKTIVWTVNENSLAKKLFTLGVDSVFTDKPNLLSIV